MMVAKAIAFDAYGTLCFIGTSTHPYRELLKFLPIPPANLRQELMTKHASLEKLTARFDVHNPELVAKVKDLIQEEVESVRPYPEVMDILDVLKRQGFRLAIVSNLAYPYAEPIIRHFSTIVDHLVFSFEVGAIKPNPRIFQVLCDRLATPAEQIVMIGDSVSSDVKGARDFGMQVLHLVRTDFQTPAEQEQHSIRDLSRVPKLIERMRS